MSTISIRTATPDDREFMFEQVARLASAAKLPWHTEYEILAFQHRSMDRMSKRSRQGTTFIADDEAGTPVGLVQVGLSTDWVTGEPCGYISVLAVTRDMEGKGVAPRLMAAAEEWSRKHGCTLISLDVFSNNERARAFYAKQDYQEETLRLTKPLSKRKR
jgi:ribosomal protein S18 acetylase RimI-like enzyme